MHGMNYAAVLRRISAGLFVFFILQTAVWGQELFEDENYSGPKTTIRFAMWGGANEVVYGREICRKFVERYPEIRVELAVYPWGHYWAKLQTQAAAGLAPDVIMLYAEGFGIWVARGALLPLDRFVEKSNFPLNDYYPVAIKNCRWEERLYALPLEISFRTLIYSIDRFEERGIPKDQWPSPERPLSWNEFKALSEKLTLRNPNGTFAQYGMAGTQRWLRVMCRMHGGNFTDRQVNPTRPAVNDGNALMRSVVEIFKTQYADRSCLGAVPMEAGAFADYQNVLLSNRFGMTLAGPWHLIPLKEKNFRFGIAPMPRGPFPSQLVGLNSVSIYSHTEHPEEAWKFLQFMASREVQGILGKRLKGVPSLIEAREDFINNDFGIEGCEAFFVDLPTADVDLIAANSYLDAEIDRWLKQTEGILDAEYDGRLRALKRINGAIPETAYKEFAAGMKDFIEETVRERWDELNELLEAAFRRAEPPKTNAIIARVLPLLLLVLLIVFLGIYITWVSGNRKDKSRGLVAGRPSRAGYLFITPWLIGLCCFILGPIISALLISFTEWNMIKAPNWIGVRYYLDLPGDRIFLIGLLRTFTYAALVIPISLIGGLFTAGLLTCDIRGRDAFKAIIYFPSLFTGAAAAVLWVNMFNKEYGIVNRLLGSIGIPPVSWMDERHALYTVILMNVFWIGSAMIIYYAGMKQIPRTLYEASEIDGAGPVRKFISITIPMLSPVILFMVIITTIGSFQIFTPALFFAEAAHTIGEPGDALRFYSVNIYSEAFNHLRMGRACCYAVILFLIIFLVTMIQLKLSKRFVHTEVE